MIMVILNSVIFMLFGQLTSPLFSTLFYQLMGPRPLYVILQVDGTRPLISTLFYQLMEPRPLYVILPVDGTPLSLRYFTS